MHLNYYLKNANRVLFRYVQQNKQHRKQNVIMIFKDNDQGAKLTLELLAICITYQMTVTTISSTYLVLVQKIQFAGIKKYSIFTSFNTILINLEHTGI